MFNLKNIFKIFVVQIIFTQIAWSSSASTDPSNEAYNHDQAIESTTPKNIFYHHQRIDIHLIDPEHLKPGDSWNIQNHSNMSYDYSCDHDYSLKKNEYCGGNPDNNIPFRELKNYESLNNKEKLLYLKKDRANTLQKSLSKNNKINMRDFTFTPFHVDIFRAP